MLPSDYCSKAPVRFATYKLKCLFDRGKRVRHIHSSHIAEAQRH